MNEDQPKNYHADTVSYTVNAKIGITHIRHGAPSRIFFHFGGFETVELANKYKDWLNNILHKFITSTEAINATKSIWIVRPIVTTSCISSSAKKGARNINLYPCNDFTYIITSILSEFDINISTDAMKSFSETTLNCAET